MSNDTLLTLQEAAAILRLKDIRTVLRWGREGRFTLRWGNISIRNCNKSRLHIRSLCGMITSTRRRRS